jgi:thiol-disulfide isomerase/thioredoxin
MRPNRRSAAAVVFAVVSLCTPAAVGRSAVVDVGPGCAADDGCDQPVVASPGGDRSGHAQPVAGGKLLFFWGVGCSHCEEAKPFLAGLAREHPDLAVEQIEVRQDAGGRERFIGTMRSLGAEAVGIPTFVVDGGYVVGFAPGVTEAAVRELVARARLGAPLEDAVTRVELPLFGIVDPSSLPLPAFTLMIGLVDGINPCAMWVLLVLLSILVHVRSRARLLLFGATFVVASGIVYFVFMVAWMHVFSLIGLSRYVTVGLGVLVLLMGLINLKELIWFEKGISLMIPDKAKPGLYRRMRGIGRSASLPAAFAGIVVLAFLVNLIELGCTVGLPAIFTRILTLRADLSDAARYGYVALYNLAYVVPLAVIVLVYAATLHRLVMTERGAKILKGVSGVLLVAFGLLLVVAPELLR